MIGLYIYIGAILVFVIAAIVQKRRHYWWDPLEQEWVIKTKSERYIIEVWAGDLKIATYKDKNQRYIKDLHKELTDYYKFKNDTYGNGRYFVILKRIR